MKNILILLDGNVAGALLTRLLEQETLHSNYDIVYINDTIIPKHQPKNFTFYKFDPTSYNKLEFIMKKVNHTNIFVVLSNKIDTLAVIDNITRIQPKKYLNVYNLWGIEFKNRNIKDYNALDILSSGLIEQLPNIPVVANNIGLKKGEIMEINIPFDSLYAYRYIGSIEQKTWKIFAVYRNNTLLQIKSNVILKPNDIILIIGKPDVLLQVYSSISNKHGNFPMPFGRDIYLYIDMKVQNMSDIFNGISKAKFLTQRLKNKKLIVKIVNPTTTNKIDKIKNKLNKIVNHILEFEYNLDIKDTLLIDQQRFNIGIVVLTSKLLNISYITKQILSLKIAIFKVGTNSISNSKESQVILNNEYEYEQIAPIIFDITSQFNHKISIVDADPLGNVNREKLNDSFKNLSDIFSQPINLIKSHKNPIKELKKDNDVLQIMPLKKNMFKNSIFKVFSMDSDLISYNFTSINQILIPIIEDLNIIQHNRRKNDI